MTAGLPLRRIALLSSIAAVASACAVLLVPVSASAATTGIELSNDGVTYSTGLAAPLYDSDMRMIPQSSTDSAFWVRNGSSEVGYLRVVVVDVTGRNADLLGALSIQADTPAVAGSPIALTAAQPCHVLTQGAVLAPGDSIRIDTALRLGDLVGSAGQNGVIDFDLQVGMSSIDPSTTPATTCIAAGTTVPVFTPTPAGGSAVYNTQQRGFSAVFGTPVGSPLQSPEVQRAGESPMPVPTFLVTAFNTMRFYQEDFVFLWVMSALISGLIVIIIARRRRHADDKNGVTE